MYDLMMFDNRGTLYFRQVDVGDYYGSNASRFRINLADVGSAVKLKFENINSKPICKLMLYRYNQPQDVNYKPYRTPVNVLPFLNKYQPFPDGYNPIKNLTLPAKEYFEILVEPGDYYMRAVDCDGNVFEQHPIRIEGNSFTWAPKIEPCSGTGKIKIGPNTKPITCPIPKDRNLLDTDTTFTDCYASLPVSSGSLLIDICVYGILKTIMGGWITIDPDGYVYNAAQGIEAVIQGATVTCDMYDEDLDTWDHWPAELYNNQVNPQVTGSDGYYAFFVPPGQYRVRATAQGYDSHTSPDIFVIDEIVHYNIPMTGGGGGLFMPFIVR